MSATTSISLSGMTAAQTALSASAFNVAHLGVEGFRRQLVVQQAVAPAGVATEIVDAAATGADLVADTVDMLQARQSFLANLAVFKTGIGLTGTLLDTMA